MLRGFAFGIKVTFLNCFKGSRKWTRLCVSLVGFLCVSVGVGVGVCVRACVKINHGSQTSFYPYELINIQSCLVWTSALLLVLFESSRTASAVRPCRRVACVALLTINALCLCHIPLSTVLWSTADCGGDACSLVLSATWGLTSCFRGQDTNVTEKPQLPADGKWKFSWRRTFNGGQKKVCKIFVFCALEEGGWILLFQSKSIFICLIRMSPSIKKYRFKSI